MNIVIRAMNNEMLVLTCSAIGVYLVNRAYNHRILHQNLQFIPNDIHGLYLCRFYIGSCTLSKIQGLHAAESIHKLLKLFLQTLLILSIIFVCTATCLYCYSTCLYGASTENTGSKLHVQSNASGSNCERFRHGIAIARCAHTIRAS